MDNWFITADDFSKNKCDLSTALAQYFISKFILEYKLFGRTESELPYEYVKKLDEYVRDRAIKIVNTAGYKAVIKGWGGIDGNGWTINISLDRECCDCKCRSATTCPWRQLYDEDGSKMPPDELAKKCQCFKRKVE